ncbi:MAG: ribonuclease E/G, partial [Caldimonas sp.]
ESSALQILRMVQEESMKDNTAAVHVQVPVEVTSFLLNEKRTEITKIELKQRVTVLLVPNKALETPNYRLERLRHDDPRLENLQASYTMIDEPEDEVGFTRREKAKAKQEPMIKGILPDTPAPQAPVVEPRPVAAVMPAPAARPIAAEPAGGGFFAWVKNLFAGGESAPAAAAQTPLPAAETARKERSARGERSDRGDRGGERGGRGSRGGRDGRRGERGARTDGDGVRADRGPRPEGEAGRGERSPRSEADAGRPERGPRAEPAEGARGETRDGRGGRGERSGARGEGRGGERDESRRGERGERGGRGERGPRPLVDAMPAAGADEAAVDQPFVDTTPSPGDGEGNGERTGGRRRNRRGGRGRDRDPVVAGTADNDGVASPTGEGRGEGEGAPAEHATRGEANGDEGAGRDDSAAGRAVDGAPEGASDGRGGRGGGRGRGRGRDRDHAPLLDADGQPLANAEVAESALARNESPWPAASSLNADPAPDFVEASATSPGAARAEALPAVDADADADEFVASAAAPVAAPAAPAPAARPAPMPVAAPAPAPASIAESRSYALPVDSLQAVAEDAGLQWVGTDAGKVKAAQEAMAAMPAPLRVPREIKPVEQVDTGPLVLVETRKDLSQVKLPFETASREPGGLG